MKKKTHEKNRSEHSSTVVVFLVSQPLCFSISGVIGVCFLILGKWE